MANEQNLIDLKSLTPSQLRQRASNGGKASAKKKREKKAMKDLLNMMLESKVKDNANAKILSKYGVDKEDTTYKAQLMYVLLSKGLKGDLASIKEIREISEYNVGADNGAKALGSLLETLSEIKRRDNE